MKIPLENISRYVKGAHSAVVDGEFLRVDRFDPGAYERYRSLGEDRLRRALCPAGVTLAFQTTSSRLRLELELGAGARDYCFADLYADGVFVASAGSTEASKRLILEAELPAAGGDFCEVEIYLPHTYHSFIRQLSVDEDAHLDDFAARDLLLAFGDSITQGFDARHPSFGYAMVAARQLGMELMNQGVGGHVFDAQGLCAAPAPNPELITVAYGVNDWDQGKDIGAAELWFDRLRQLYPDVPVYVLEPVWAPSAGMDINPKPNQTGMTLPDVRAELSALMSGRPQTEVVAYEDLIPQCAHFFVDGVHPGDAGHLAYGLNLANYIRNWFDYQFS